MLQFALVTGHDREEIGILGWPNLSACRKLCGAAAESLSDQELLCHPQVEAHLRSSLEKFNTAQQGSSTRIARIMLMAEPPDSDANEITDKGYINQRAALQRRQHLVEQLYADPPGKGVLLL